MATINKITIELNADTESYGCTNAEMDDIIDKVENIIIAQLDDCYPGVAYSVSHNHMHGAISDKIHVDVKSDDNDLVPMTSQMELENETIEHIQTIIQNANSEVMNW